MTTRSALADEGVIRLSGEITQASVEPLINTIIQHNLEAGLECIRLFINSPGGDVDQGFALIDIMGWSRIPIHTTALGLIGSMALLVFMAGEHGHRTVMPHCSLLSHRFGALAMGNHADLLAARVQQDLVHRRIVEHYRHHTRLKTAEAVEQELLPATDRWLSPEQAVEYGVADRVWQAGEVQHA